MPAKALKVSNIKAESEMNILLRKLLESLIITGFIMPNGRFYRAANLCATLL
jgi:hypothetical protein